MQVQLLAFYWYPSEDDYKKMKSLAEDSSNLHGTFAEWLSAAENGFKEMQSRGNRTVIKIEAPTDEFITWCKTTGRNVNGHSRNNFANHKLHLLIKDGKIKIDTQQKNRGDRE